MQAWLQRIVNRIAIYRSGVFSLDEQRGVVNIKSLAQAEIVFTNQAVVCTKPSGR